MIPALLLSLIFLVPAWWLWQKGMTGWALLPLITGLILLGFTLAIKLDDVYHRQVLADAEVLLRELNRPDLWTDNNLSEPDDRIFLASIGSQALYRTRPLAPELHGQIDSTLFQLADWASRRDNLRQWRRNANWDQEVYFLAHAGATLGHFQLATGNEAYADAWKNIGQHLGTRLQRGRYKHLPSRPEEDFFRPADNAAALYALSLYDQANGTNYAVTNFNDWADYIKHELYFEESRLPCAAFSVTSRCHLEPSATATGLYIAYRAAAWPEAVDTDIPWREWLHYFGKTSLSPFSLGIRTSMRAGKTTRFCDQGSYPLDCGRYEGVVGLWAAREYGANYTYFRLYSGNALRRWFFPDEQFARLSPAMRVKALTRVAIRAVGAAE